MKKIKRIVVILVLLTLLVFVHNNFGLFNRFNFVTAYVDRWMGKERIIIYGEPFETDSLKAALAPRFGFTFERHAGCNVTRPFVNGVRDYNKIMERYLSERLGQDWDEVLEKEIGRRE